MNESEGRSIASQVQSGLVLAGRIVGAIGVWWFGGWTWAWFIFTPGVEKLLFIPFGLIAVFCLVLAATGWPLKGKPRGLDADGSAGRST